MSTVVVNEVRRGLHLNSVALMQLSASAWREMRSRTFDHGLNVTMFGNNVASESDRAFEALAPCHFRRTRRTSL